MDSYLFAPRVAEATLTGPSRIVSVLAQSLMIASILVGCTTTEIYPYPRHWPAMRDAQQRCAIEGEYVNAGVIEPASMSPSTNGPRRLNALLRPDSLGPIGSPTADRVAFAVAANTLVVTVPGEAAPAMLPMRGDLSTCAKEGHYQIEFSKPYDDESGAGTLHITQSLALADDGSLIVESKLFFDASRSVIVRHKNMRVVWYRFMRTH